MQRRIKYFWNKIRPRNRLSTAPKSSFHGIYCNLPVIITSNNKNLSPGTGVKNKLLCHTNCWFKNGFTSNSRKKTFQVVLLNQLIKYQDRLSHFRLFSSHEQPGGQQHLLLVCRRTWPAWVFAGSGTRRRNARGTRCPESTTRSRLGYRVERPERVSAQMNGF